MQTKVEKRYSSGLTVLGSYIFSKTIGDSCGVVSSGGVRECEQDPLNYRLERALDNQHVKHRYVTSFIYELPFGRGRPWGSSLPGAIDAVLGGWNITGIVVLTSGNPFTITTQGDPANSDTTDRPNLIGDPFAGESTIERYFNIAAFQRNAQFTYGNLGRNTMSGPSRKIVDFSVMKDWRIRESASLQFRLEAFNLFNRPNFNNPAASLGASNFGRISSVGQARKLQGGIKILF